MLRSNKTKISLRKGLLTLKPIRERSDGLSIKFNPLSLNDAQVADKLTFPLKKHLGQKRAIKVKRTINIRST